MKKLAIAIIFATLGVITGFAQHSATLTWKASADSTAITPGTASVYRASGACPATGIGTASYSLLSVTAPAGGPYVDTSVTGGATFCYYVTASISGGTSDPSNTCTVTVPLAAPTNLTGTVK